jgi:hypothetical protein
MRISSNTSFFLKKLYYVGLLLFAVLLFGGWLGEEIIGVSWLTLLQERLGEETTPIYHSIIISLSLLCKTIFPLLFYAGLFRVVGVDSYVQHIYHHICHMMRGGAVKAELFTYITLAVMTLPPHTDNTPSPFLRALLSMISPLCAGAGAVMIYDIGVRTVLLHSVLPAFMGVVAAIGIIHFTVLKENALRILENANIPKTALAAKSYRIREGRIGRQLASFTVVTLNGAISICCAIIFGYIVHHMTAWVQHIHGISGVYLFIWLGLSAYIGLLWLASVQPSEKNTFSSILYAGLYHLLSPCVMLWLLVVEQVELSRALWWGCALLVCNIVTAEAIISSFRQLRRLKQPNIIRELIKGGRRLSEGMVISVHHALPLSAAIVGAGMILWLCEYYGVLAWLVRIIDQREWLWIMLAGVCGVAMSYFHLPFLVQYFFLYSITRHVIADDSTVYFTLLYWLVIVRYAVETWQHKQDCIGHACSYGIVLLIVLLCVLSDAMWMLQNINTVLQGMLVALIGAVAVLLLCAGVQGYFIKPILPYERLLLCVAALTLLLPTLILQLFSPEYAQKIMLLNAQMAKYIVYFPALCMVALVYISQRFRA